MSRYHRAAVLAAWIVAVAFVFSSATPAALADSDGATAKVTKKAKKSKSGEKKAADKKVADKKAGRQKGGRQKGRGRQAEGR